MTKPKAKPKAKAKLLVCYSCQLPGELILVARQWYHIGCWRARKPLPVTNPYPYHGAKAANDMIAQGKRAFAQGLSESDCPYVGTFRALWRAGFNAARKHAQYGK